MMEEILIPMKCRYDIPSLNQMAMPSYKAGDIFLYNPFHEVHVELDEHGCFEEIENKLCKFICQYPDIMLNGKYYQVGEKIADEDIQNTSDEVIKNLCYVGYIQKIFKPQKNTSSNKQKNQKAKKTTSETYTILAQKLGLDKTTFKKTIFDKLGIEVKDMRKKVPLKTKKEILKVLGK